MEKSKIRLRHATIDDIEILEYWDKQPHVIAAAPDDDWDWKEELTQRYQWRELLISELDGEPIGFLAIIDPAEEETHYWGTIEPNLRALDIWIGEARNLNKGYGAQMMKLAFERCFHNPKVKAILIDPLASNTAAHRFYERLGFEFIEERSFYGDDCFVYQLTREKWLKSASN